MKERRLRCGSNAVNAAVMLRGRNRPISRWGHVAPGTAPRVRTTPTTADLVSYWGGQYRLLRVREGAEQLGACNASVYRLVENGELPHVRIVNSIRIRPDDLEAFLRGVRVEP